MFEYAPQIALTWPIVVDFCKFGPFECKNMFDLKVWPRECGEYLISKPAEITFAPPVPK